MGTGVKAITGTAGGGQWMTTGGQGRLHLEAD